MTYTLTSNLPSAAGFAALRAHTDWGKLSLSQAKAALSASLCGVSLYDVRLQKGAPKISLGQIGVGQNNKAKPPSPQSLIGMARVIGDGILNLYIQDVIIAAPYRGKGLGGQILSALITDMQRNFPQDCTIGLMAAKGQAPFYARFGFNSRPSVTVDAGMSAALNSLSTPQGLAKGAALAYEAKEMKDRS